MSTFTARIAWSRTTPDFEPGTYDRSHVVTYGSGVEVPASSAPDFKGDPTRMNPEEALVGALSSCHMLTFLAVASRKKLIVERYEDAAEGALAKNAEGRLAVTRVVLRPRVAFASPVPADEIAHLHAQAHQGCFIASSVKTEVVIEPAG